MNQPRTRDGNDRNDSLVLVIFVVLSVFRSFVALDLDNTLRSFLLSLNTLVGQLLHHFQEFLPVVFEQVVRNRENSTCTKQSAPDRDEWRG